MRVPDAPHGLGPFEHILVQVAVAIGSCSMPLRDVLRLGPGAVVTLDRTAGSPVDLLVHDEPGARGELIAVDERYAIRIHEVLERER